MLDLDNSVSEWCSRVKYEFAHHHVGLFGDICGILAACLVVALGILRPGNVALTVVYTISRTK